MLLLRVCCSLPATCLLAGSSVAVILVNLVFVPAEQISPHLHIMLLEKKNQLLPVTQIGRTPIMHYFMAYYNLK